MGTVGLTIIKKADLFIAPFSDVHTSGFIAIGNLFSPAENGGKVCNISIKGPREKVEKYMQTIKEIASSEA